MERSRVELLFLGSKPSVLTDRRTLQSIQRENVKVPNAPKNQDKIDKIGKTQSPTKGIFFIGAKSLRNAYLTYLIRHSCIAPPFVRGLCGRVSEE